MSLSEVADAVVLGAGIHGLCAAFALRGRGRTVTVLDRFPAGHSRGGSHGAGRITRSSYHDRQYVELAQRAHGDGWPRLEAALGEKLVYQTPGVFFGPADGPFARFLTATLDAGVAVERISAAAAARAFPALRFAPEDAVLLDHTAGVIAANRVVVGLRRWLQADGVTMRDCVLASSLRPTSTGVEVQTSDGVLRARAVVIATGAWLGELLPEWRGRITALRQQVGYVRIAAPAAAVAVGSFPVWARIGLAPTEFDYGLPEFGGPGLKLGRHITVGPGDDPNGMASAVDEGALLALADARFSFPVEAVVGSEHCLYAVTPGEHLHVVPAVMDSRIVAVAACSGHGFKFGPVVGEQVAGLLAST